MSVSNSKQLRRNTNDKMIAGVAAGLADFMDVDVTLVRVIWAITVIFGGFGIIAYLVMWIVVPVEGSDRSVANDLVDGKNKPSDQTEEE